LRAELEFVVYAPGEHNSARADVQTDPWIGNRFRLRHFDLLLA